MCHTCILFYVIFLSLQQQDTSPESVTSPPPGLDTLSKDDLIKFAKKQMAAIQKMKSKCDVQEDEEEPSGRSSGMARMLELSGLSLIDASDGETQSRQLRSALEDQQSQNTMLQEELTFLGNVKTELEAELERVREEFHTENEELQFKIEELLMTREVATPNRDLLSLETPNRDLQEAQAFTQLQQSGPQRDSVDGLPASPASPSSPRQSLSCPVPGATHQSLTLQEQQGQAQELRSQCESLDRSQAVAEYEHTRDILRGLETEQGQRTGDVTRQYEAMKEQAASAVQELQESIRRLTEERDGLVERVKGLNEDRDSLLEKVQGLEKRLESFLKQTQAAERLKEQLQTSMEEKTALALKLKNSVEAQTVLASELKASLEVQTVLAVELRASVEDLSKQNGEILSQLQMRESAVQELEETVNVVSTERDRTLSALQDREMEVMRLWEERAREVEESQGQREEVAELQARIEELEKERSLLKSNLELVQRESCKNVQGSPGEEVEELQARIEELEKERSLLKSNLGEVVGDTEALQKDLREMKLANEKMRTENQELLTQVSQATETLADREREEKEGREEEEEQAEKERRELQQQLTEKDTVISQLRSEMAALLEKERKEKDERMNKIKAVAVKARKELDTSRKEAVSLKEEVEVLKAERERVTSSMKDIIHGAEGYKNLQLDYDRQTEQLDKERETVEGAEKQISELTKRLNNAVQQHEQLWSEREDLMTELETLRNTVRQMEGQTAELHRQTDTLNRDLQAEELLKEQKTKELSSLQKDMEELTVQLRRQKQQSQQTTQELEQLRKEAQQSSLLDMEMADYERLVKELNTKLSEKDVCVEELKTQIHTHTQKEDTLNQEIEVLKSQLDQGEDKSSKMKQLLVKTKKDLADAKRQIQCCDLTAERHRLQEQLRTLTEQQQRTSSSLQQRLTTLQQEANTAKAELSSVTAEFDSYKVRVHNVLKQQKNKTSAQSDGDATKQEREQMESLVDQYKAKLQDSQQSLAVSTAELQQLQMEHDTLLERHNKILQETVAKEAELRERFMSLQAEIMSLRTEHAQTVGQLTSQAVAQRSGFREQIRHLQDEHRTTVETLQNQMTRLENQLFTLQKQTSPAPVQTSRKSAVDRRPVDQGGTGGLGLGDLQSMAREEGEGMETSETESLSSTYLPSLEQLLTSPDPKQEPFVWQVEPTKEELNQKLTTATRSMEHMNSLLHETEATNAVLNEQVNLLKSEVRRLERNHEREKSVANLEYLKNVLLQFIFLQSGSERQALLPVIHTMLQLSPEEKNKLAAIAMGRYTHTVNKHTYIYTHTHCKQTHIYIYKHTL
uniref:GRIP and coiled-coil domain containing 2 n=1 Tax=Oncorhynchus kisutch TaxID=8019 RepID=A0A8C7C8H7_ONCKI